MKKLFMTLLMCAVSLPGMAGDGYVVPVEGAHWRVGAGVGVVTPVKGGGFFSSMRPAAGFDFSRAFTPSLALGVEAVWSVNTSRLPRMQHSATFFDHSYIGAYGQYELLPSASRFGIALMAGAGWGRRYVAYAPDHSFFATTAGLSLSFRLSNRLSLVLSPAFVWNMSDADISGTSAGYKASRCMFGLRTGVRYRFGSGFEPVRVYDSGEIDALNGQVNTLRSNLDECGRRVEAMAADHEESSRRPAEIVREVAVDNRFNTVYDVFFHAGRSDISRDQLPNIERIAAALKNNPQSRVVIEGYASPEGGSDVNSRLATDRANAVRDVLTGRYGIPASRITARGCGVGHIFDDEAWNRVSVCTIYVK